MSTEKTKCELCGQKTYFPIKITLPELGPMKRSIMLRERLICMECALAIAQHVELCKEAGEET